MKKLENNGPSLRVGQSGNMVMCHGPNPELPIELPDLAHEFHHHPVSVLEDFDDLTVFTEQAYDCEHSHAHESGEETHLDGEPEVDAPHPGVV